MVDNNIDTHGVSSSMITVSITAILIQSLVQCYLSFMFSHAFYQSILYQLTVY